jgi:toxin ParE1/3/4
MKYSIVLTETARADLSAIFRYIAGDSQSVQNANGQLSRIEKAIASLDQMPERYRVYDRKNWRERNMRIMPVDNYLVFYVPTRDDLTVTVMRVMYGGRDVDRQLEMPETK